MSKTTATKAPGKARIIGRVNKKRPKCDSEGCRYLAGTLHVIEASSGESVARAACKRHDWGAYWFNLYGPDSLLDGDALDWWHHLLEKPVSYRQAVMDWLEDRDLMNLWVLKIEEQARRVPDHHAIGDGRGRWTPGLDAGSNFVGYLSRGS